MNSTEPQFAELLERARLGDRDAVGELLDGYRPWLRLLAKRQIGRRLEKRLDASDVIQQTCLSAVAKIDLFNGHTEAEFVAWLRRIHECNLQNVVRDNVLRQKRAVSREASINDSRTAGLINELPILQSSPSQRVLQDERAVLLVRTLERLSEEQRDAIRLRYLEGLPVATIADEMNRSVHSVAGLIRRGLERLRTELRSQMEGEHDE
jgi:RNA polymerase sigma-70 factor (ECF subfamily)